METVGIFEAKAKLSEICEQVASTRESIVVTRRGKPLVRILPMEVAPESVLERRNRYLKTLGRQECDDDVDFEPAERSLELSRFHLDE